MKRKPDSVDLVIYSVENEVKNMEYVYAAMLLHAAEKDIDEKVLAPF